MKDEFDSQTVDLYGDRIFDPNQFFKKPKREPKRKQYAGTKTPAKLRDEFRTPDYLFNYLNSIYKFDIDLACTTDNSKLESGYFVDQGVDALKKSWRKSFKTGFCNPPYSNIGPWLEKAIKERNKGFVSVFVIPTPNGDKWAHLLKEASKITFITGRISFICPETLKPKSGNTRGTCVAAFKHKGIYKNFTQTFDFVKRKDLECTYS